MRTWAPVPSVQKTSPLKGSADAAAIVSEPAWRATLTATSMLRTA
nr:hypothetical protein [Actinomadura physcomitrii]